MAQDDIPGVMGAPGGPGGRQGALGGARGSRVPPAPKRVIKQQNNGPKPWFSFVLLFYTYALNKLAENIRQK